MSERARSRGEPGRSIGLSARSVVAERLLREVQQYPELSVGPLDTGVLDERDATFANALYDAAIRRWVTIEWLCGRFSRRPLGELEPGVRVALLLGGAQLLGMGSVPTHAAIDESVEWVKRAVRFGAGGLVNAVLRKVASVLGDAEDGEWAGGTDEIPLNDHRVIRLVGLELPEGFVDRVGIASGLPKGLVDTLARERGEAATLRVARASLTRPPAILSLPAGGALPAGTVAHDEDGFAVWDGARGGLEAVLRRGDLWAQDPTSAASVGSIGDLAGEIGDGLIVDLCAGQGTKTRQLARLFPHARITATDTDSARLSTLASVFEAHDRVVVADHTHACGMAAGRADLVLLDVPCSNSGVLARRVEARHRATSNTVRRLVEIQRSIVADAGRLLSDRGCILYATCSLHRGENEDQAVWAAEELGMLALRERLSVPDGRGVSSRDGGYSVLLTGPGRLGWGA